MILKELLITFKLVKAFKIISWNVAGLRALLKNHPTALPSLATDHDADVICLQETKLQEMHVIDPKLKIQGHLLEEEGFDGYYSCSTTKKGYSGTAVFIKRRDGSSRLDHSDSKKKQATLGNFFTSKESDSKGKSDQVLSETKIKSNTTSNIKAKDLIAVKVSKQLGNDEHDVEGRSITVDFPLFSLTNLYVPNSGQKLERLSYRTETWDTDLLNFMKEKKRDRKTPVIWLGDLNVAHTYLDVWNDGAKHLAKQAGTTAEERASFQRQLDDGEGFIDAFRHLHPEAKGHYSYWSQRAGNREPNKGLRLDYFICSQDLFRNDPEQSVLVRDSYMIPEQLGSDHCPVVLNLEIKNS